MTAVLEAHGFGKRYRRRSWALRGVDLTVPEGTITALVGPNGSGKSTLIRAWIGFERATEGRLSTGGIDPRVDRAAAVARVGYVPQSPSLYGNLTIAEHITLATTLRDGFDSGLAAHYIERLSIPLSAVASELSGGEQAQVGLALALGTRAKILLLDEPLASLDPLARREFLQILMETVAEQGVSVVLSSHLVADLERVCDYLVVLVASRVRVAGPGDKLLACHHRLIGAPRDPATLPANQEVIESSHTERQSTMLVRTDGPIHDPAWTVEDVSLEDLVLAYMGQAAGAQRGRRQALKIKL